MRLLPLAIGLLLTLPAALALVPTASAARELPPLVGVCVDDVTSERCFRDGWICVGFSYQVPQCVHRIDIACTEICSPCTDIACELSAQGPVVPVGVCVAKESDEYGCFRDSDVCVSAFSWVPQCADVPCYRPNDCFETRDPCDLLCAEPCDFGCDSASAGPGGLVGVCVDDVTRDGCYDGAWICLEVSRLVPFCVDHLPVRSASSPWDCMDYYRETEVGPVRIVERSSCDIEVYVNGQGGDILA